jgi:hypothetical protein
MAYELGGYKKRGRGGWKTVFIIIVLLQFVGLGIYLYFSKKDRAVDSSPHVPEASAPATLAPAPAPLDFSPSAPLPLAPSPEVSSTIADARSAIEAGQLNEAKTMLDQLVDTTPDPEAIKLLGEVNIQILKSPRMMEGKEYYSIQSGDYLQKIARNHNTTVALLKQMNGMQTDTIQLGARMLVFNGGFKIHVSKSRNELDLMLNGRLFKRYSVGTGKFGKTPSVEFAIVDKIVEPPWTRPSDNKQIEYGDPENVLGTRWMKIVSEDHPEITGYGIHGTWERDSIGQQSSAGCVRMLNENVEELFDLVPRKTPVIIIE